MGTKRFKAEAALITGAAQRLGASIARALALQGIHVVIHYQRSKTAALDLQGEIAASGGRASILQGDLEKQESLEHLVGSAIDLAGPLDILINNASIFEENSFSEMTLESLQQNMTINTYAPLVLSRHFAAQGRHGNIVNMVDTMVMDYDRKHVPYHLSKRALHALTRIMALEFAPAVRVNAVAPGLVLPPKGENLAYLERLSSSNPLLCHGGAEDVVEAVLYLLRADFVTGQTVYVDGGRHMRGSMYE